MIRLCNNREEITKARSTKDYRKVKSFYESTFSSLISLNSTFKVRSKNFPKPIAGRDWSDPDTDELNLNNI